MFTANNYILKKKSFQKEVFQLYNFSIKNNLEN